jgi:hypothetical protein
MGTTIELPPTDYESFRDFFIPPAEPWKLDRLGPNSFELVCNLVLSCTGSKERHDVRGVGVIFVTRSAGSIGQHSDRVPLPKYAANERERGVDLFSSFPHRSVQWLAAALNCQQKSNAFASLGCAVFRARRASLLTVVT